MLLKGKKILFYLLRFFNKFDLILLKINSNRYLLDSKDLDLLSIEFFDLKIELIDFVLKDVKLQKSYKQHLFSLLYMNDDIFHKKSCLIRFLLDNNLKAKEISAPFLSKNDLNLFQKFNIQVRKINTNRIKLTFISMLLLLLKNFIHYNKAIKLYPENNSKYDNNIHYYRIFKSFNIQAHNIFLERITNSLENTIIYVKPYIKGMALKRQQEYIEYLKKNDKNYFFYVPKLSYIKLFKNAIKIQISQYPKEFKIPLFRIVMQRETVDDYVNYIKRKFKDIREFYTSEEFESKTSYLSEKLKKNKVKVINFAHGLGVYGTYNNYDVFYVFSKLQKRHYLNFGNPIYKYFELKTPLSKNEKGTSKKFALFFVATTFSNSRRSNSLYKEVINYVEKLAREFNFHVYAKYHPESTGKDKILSNNIKIVDNIEDLPSDCFFLAITFISIYVIELLNSMPFIIINPKNRLNLSYCFPKNNFFNVSNYTELKKKIYQFLNNPDFYNNYWKELFSIFKENYII